MTDGKPASPADHVPHGWAVLLNPIVALALLIVSSVIALIGLAALGWDKGVVLNSMARAEFARGLITYLFAVVTIGTAVVLVVAALMSEETEAHEKRFQRGKEILSLLLGVFGTIVGYYFGAETSSAIRAESGAFRITTLQLRPDSAEVGEPVTVAAVVIGGAPPYRYGTAFGNDTAEPTAPVEDDGWITTTVKTRELKVGERARITVTVQDANGRRTSQTAHVSLRARTPREDQARKGPSPPADRTRGTPANAVSRVEDGQRRPTP